MDKRQIDKFREAAREAECDLDEKKFDEQLRKVAKAEKTKGGKPKPAPSK